MQFMIRRICFLLFVSAGLAAAAENQPSDASVKQLLEVTRVHAMLDTMMAQIDSLMKQAMQQATQGQPVSPGVQSEIDKARAETMSMVKEFLTWDKLEPMYVRVYQKSFSQREIENLIAMYQTPAGQTLLTKMPLVMQNTMAEMQQVMQPIMQRIQRTQQEVSAKVQSEKAKNGS